MNQDGYRQISRLVGHMGYEVRPEPELGESIKFFDIISDEAKITPSSLLNAIHRASSRGQKCVINTEDVLPQVIGIQSHCVTFVDGNITEKL
jgi:hypothetical protein